MNRVIVVLLLGILCRSAFAEKNFWNNEICTTDRDCWGLTSCHPTFGCTLSGAKVGLVMVVVFLVFCATIAAFVWVCRRNLRRNNFARHNQYLPQPVITTNTPAWNQQPMVTTTVYPNNPNQFNANSDNPPAYNTYLADSRGGGGMNVNQMPTAPYPTAPYPTAPYPTAPYPTYAHAQESKTYHSKN